MQDRILRREAATGADHRERLEQIAQEKQDLEARLAALRDQWEKTGGLVEKMRNLRAQLESAVSADAAAPAVDVAALRTELDTLLG